MHEQNPWKTPFGRLIIGSAIIAAVVGFSMAAGIMTYFKSAAAGDAANSDTQIVNYASESLSVPEASDADASLNQADQALTDAASAEQPYYGEDDPQNEAATTYENAPSETAAADRSIESSNESEEQE